VTTVRAELRVIRVNVQSLQTCLTGLAGPDDTSAAAYEAQRAAWAEDAGDIDAELASIGQRLAAGEVKAEIDDEVEKLRNAWSRAKRQWETFPTGAGTEAERLARVATIDGLLGSMVRGIGFLTIPQRLAEFVQQQRTGGVVKFHEEFRDELPDEADRVALLKYLAASPRSVAGIVDVDHGLILVVGRGGVRRVLSYIITLGILAAGAVITGFAPQIADQLRLGPPAGGRDDLFAAYVLVAVGVIGHIVLDLYKAVRRGGAAATGIEDSFIWGHAHEMQMIATAFSVWVATAILAIAFTRIEWGTALLGGYTADSLIDTALARFDQVVSSNAPDLTGRVAALGATA